MGSRLSLGWDPDSPRNRRNRRRHERRSTHESALRQRLDGNRTSDQMVGGSNPSGRATSRPRFLADAPLSTAISSVEFSRLRVWFPLGRPVESGARDLSFAESCALGLRSQMPGRALRVCLNRQCPNCQGRPGWQRCGWRSGRRSGDIDARCLSARSPSVG